MPFNFKKFFEGIKIVPKASSTANAKGEFEVDSVTGKANYHNGTTLSPIVTEDHDATLENKDIDAETNTISNISDDEIKAGAAIDATKIADGTVNNTEFQSLNGISSNIQTQLDAKLDDFSSTTDNALLRSDGTSGEAVQDSGIIIDDSDNVSGVSSLGLDGPITDASLTASKALATNGSKAIVSSSTSATELGYLSGVTSPVQTQLNAKLDDFSSANDNRLVRTNGTAGDAIQESPVTLDDSGNMSGVGTLGLTGPVTDQSLTANRALASNGSKAIVSTSVTDTELGRLSGVTSAIQTQLDGKINDTGDTMSGNLSMGGNSITSLADPVSATDAANKQYVDGVAQGLDVKASVRVATTVAGTLATSFENGDTIDGVVLATGNRILIKNQAAPAENGIYVVAASGAPTRALDANAYEELVGAFTFVEEGTTNADTGWVCSANSGGTLGVTSLPFVQFSTAGAVTTDGEGIEITGNQLSLELDGTTLSKSASGLKVNEIADAQIAAAAAIARSKLASGNNYRILANNSSGVMSENAALTAAYNVYADANGQLAGEAQTALVRGGSAIDNSQVNDNTTTGSAAVLNAVSGHVRLTNASLVSLGTIPAPASGGIQFTLYNDTGNAVTILNDTGATSANRIYTGTGGDLSLANGKTLLLKYDGTDQRWLLVGGTGTGTSSGGINYILNPDAETNTTGWSTYADAAATSPVDGTGGSPNSTWTRNTSSPLRNNADFVLTKNSGSSRQGEGVGYAFTIDAADKAQVLRISFDYLGSANFVYGDGTVTTPSDIRVFIYDVTNSVLIEPSQTLLTGSGKYVSEFQSASNSTSYRLIFHIAATHTNAWTFQVDNVSVGPREIARGPMDVYLGAITTTGSWSTNTTYTSQYWRRGDKLYGSVKLALAGAPTAATLTVTLPNSLSIDTTKVLYSDNSRSKVGYGWIRDSGTNSYSINAISQSSTPTAIDITYDDDAAAAVSNNNTVNATTPITFASGDSIIFTFEVPILGWGSNTITSSDSGTRTVAANLNLSGNQTVSSTSETTISFATAEYDTTGIFSLANNGFVIKESGIYNFDLQSYVTSMTADENVYLAVKVNGSIVRQLFYPLSSTIGSYAISGQLKLNSGDIVIGVIKSAVDTSYTLDGSSSRTFFSINKIQSPQTIGMADTVAFYAVDDAPSSSAFNETANLIFGSDSQQFKDSHGAYNATTGVYTAPISGWYVIAGRTRVGGTEATNQQLTLSVFKNSSVFDRGQTVVMNSGLTNVTVNIYTEAYLNAGDTIALRISTDITGAAIVTNNNGHQFSVRRAG